MAHKILKKIEKFGPSKRDYLWMKVEEMYVLLRPMNIIQLKKGNMVERYSHICAMNTFLYNFWGEEQKDMRMASPEQIYKELDRKELILAKLVVLIEELLEENLV